MGTGSILLAIGAALAAVYVAILTHIYLQSRKEVRRLRVYEKILREPWEILSEFLDEVDEDEKREAELKKLDTPTFLRRVQ